MLHNREIIRNTGLPPAGSHLQPSVRHGEIPHTELLRHGEIPGMRHEENRMSKSRKLFHDDVDLSERRTLTSLLLSSNGAASPEKPDR